MLPLLLVRLLLLQVRFSQLAGFSSILAATTRQLQQSCSCVGLEQEFSLRRRQDLYEKQGGCISQASTLGSGFWGVVAEEPACGLELKVRLLLTSYEQRLTAFAVPELSGNITAVEGLKPKIESGDMGLPAVSAEDSRLFVWTLTLCSYQHSDRIERDTRHTTVVVREPKPESYSTLRR